MITTTRVTDDGVAIVTLDVPGSSVNTFRLEHATELGGALDAVETDSTVKAIVLISGKPDNFVAGADVEQFAAYQTVEEAEAACRAGQAFVTRIEAMKKPIVVAIHGACLGLGLELSLACDYRIATDDPKTQLGLPEIQLGIIPAAGGCTRLPRLIGLRAAFDIILAGKSERAAKALRLGLVDEVVPRSILLDVATKAASRLAQGPASEAAPPSGRPSSRPAKGSTMGVLLDQNPLGRRIVYRSARRQVLRKTRGHYPAPLAAIDVIRIGMEKGRTQGFEAEAKAFGKLAMSQVSRELVRIFFATNALKKDDGVGAVPVTPRPVSLLGIIGSGFMGAGIAGTTVTTAKIPVRLKDADLGRVGRGIKAALAIPQGRLDRRRMSRFEFERIAALITGGIDYRGFERADLVVEAVFEDLAVKRQVLAEIEAIVGERAIFASNTSTIPIAKIAEGAKRPYNVLGMHFFSPVDRMPLVEVIPTLLTDPNATATVVRFGRSLGKTVIVVADRPGFWVNRIFAPYGVEAGHLLMEGVPIEIIDSAMTRFGFPVGPITLSDEVGIDVAAKAGQVMAEAYGERMQAAPVIEKMVAAGRLGRKAGQGFYLYHDGEKTDPDPKVYQMLGVTPRADVIVEEVERRMLMPFLNEAARALGEGVVRSPRDGDIGAIFGLGYPPFRGGPLRTIDTIGPTMVVEQLERLAANYGPRFTPCEALVDLAKSGRRYYE